MKASFKVDGVAQMEKTLRGIRDVLQAKAESGLAENVREALKTPMDGIAAAAQAAAPMGKTGNLKRSIHSGTGRGAAACWAWVLAAYS